MKKYAPIVLTIFFISLIFITLKPIFIYICISLLLSFLLHPIAEFLSSKSILNKRIPKGWFAGLLIFISLGLVGLLINLIIPDISKQLKTLSMVDTKEIIDSYEIHMDGFNTFMKEKFGLNNFDIQPILIENYDKILSVSDFSGALGKATAFTGNILLGVFCVAFISFFMIKDKEVIFSLPKKWMSYKNHQLLNSIIDKAQTPLKRYFIGVITESIIVFLLVSLGLMLFGYKNVLLLGAIAGALNLIPYLGPIISLVVGLSIISVGQGDINNIDILFGLLGKASLIYLSVQLIDNFVLQPIIYSNSVQAHPLEVFIVILIGGHLWGVKGMIFAIPVYTVLKIFIREYFAVNKV